MALQNSLVLPYQADHTHAQARPQGDQPAGPPELPEEPVEPEEPAA